MFLLHHHIILAACFRENWRWHKKKSETDKAKELLDLSKPAKQKAFTLSAPSAM
jgi:hypothetical protein